MCRGSRSQITGVGPGVTGVPRPGGPGGSWACPLCHISHRGGGGHGGRTYKGLQVERYGYDVLVRSKSVFSSPRPASARGVIKALSHRSRRRLNFVLRNAWPKWVAFITLTYPAVFPASGLECKKHLDRFLRAMKKRWPYTRYFWVLEFQERGAPHFHIVVNAFIPKAWISAQWARSVFGDVSSPYRCDLLRAGTRVEGVRRDKAGVCKYFAKYAAKQEQKEVPGFFQDVGRFWGSSRDLVRRVAKYISWGFNYSSLQYKVLYRTVRVLRRYIKSKWGYKCRRQGFIAIGAAGILDKILSWSVSSVIGEGGSFIYTPADQSIM